MSLEESTREVLEEGDEAPAFSLPGTGGKEYSLDDFSDNNALLIVFTCNHCPYAKAKIPVLNSIAGDYDDVAVVGVNPNDAEEYPEDSFERMKELVEAGEVRYDAYLRDESQDVARAYGAVCTPDPYLFVNDDGVFRLAYHGSLDDSLNPKDLTRSSELQRSSSSALNPDDEPSVPHMREAIEAVLAGKPVDKEFLPSQGCSIKWK